MDSKQTKSASHPCCSWVFERGPFYHEVVDGGATLPNNVLLSPIKAPPLAPMSPLPVFLNACPSVSIVNSPLSTPKVSPALVGLLGLLSPLKKMGCGGLVPSLIGLGLLRYRASVTDDMLTGSAVAL